MYTFNSKLRRVRKPKAVCQEKPILKNMPLGVSMNIEDRVVYGQTVQAEIYSNPGLIELLSQRERLTTWQGRLGSGTVARSDTLVGAELDVHRYRLSLHRHQMDLQMYENELVEELIMHSLWHLVEQTFWLYCASPDRPRDQHRKDKSIDTEFHKIREMSFAEIESHQ